MALPSRGAESISSRAMNRSMQTLALVLAALSCVRGAPTPQTAANATPGGGGVARDGTVLTAAAGNEGAVGARGAGAPLRDASRVPVGSSPVRGRADALVTVVVFSDFQCPFCGRVESTLRALSERYGDDLRVVWKNNPLPFHDNARPAAEAAMAVYEAAGSQAFWRFHDMLFENQQHLGPEDLEGYVRALGVDVAAWRAALDGHARSASIDNDMALAEQLGAQGTPTFFINGTQLVGAQPLERFVAVIDPVLARAREITPRESVYEAMVANPVASPDEAPPSRPTQRPARPDPEQVLRVDVAGAPALGPASALVTMVVFSDFQCPFCARVEPTIASLRRRFGNDLRVVWRNEPLPFHQSARPAAEAAMEALAQRGVAGFWRMHDTLFENQQHLDRESLEGYAQAQGLDMTRFRAALDAHTHEPTIAADEAIARRLQADGTPHFFINGRRLIGAQPEERFVAAIERARTEARAWMREHPGTTPANFYARLMATADETVRAAGGGAEEGDEGNDEQRVYTVRAARNAPYFGGANARVVIEHFTDLQCPFCARVQGAIGEIRAHYGDRVRFVWRHYPLPFHDHAMLAAEAAQEAFAQQGNDGFWRMTATLFDNQQHLERADLERYAQDQGLDMARFRRALDQHTHQARIRDDMAAADATGAQIGTPAFFINGRFVAGAYPFAEFQRRIDAALAERR